jgi:predicted protein tyrosine phosphatase
MLHVFVGSKNQALSLVERHQATHWISLLDHGDRQFLPTCDLYKNINKLFLNCEDVLKPDVYGAVTKEQVHTILNFTKDITSGVVVVNCFAGVSRSTAAALAILTQHHKSVDAACKMLLDVRPNACPNPVISKYADELLGMNGELFEASEKIAKSRLFSFIK